MMDLPYQVKIVNNTDHFDAVLNWCHAQWPHSQGLTWRAHQTSEFKIFVHARTIPGQSVHTHKFGWIYALSFQREEDFILYQITWA